MTSSHPRVRIFPGSGDVEDPRDLLLARDIVRFVFFVPHDHFEIAAAVSHALDGYLRVVKGHPTALSRYTNCYWEPYQLTEEVGWPSIRSLLAPTERRYADDYTLAEISHATKEGADPYFGLYGEPGSGFRFEYYARIPWREALPNAVSFVGVTLPTECLEERGAGFMREFALDMAFRLPFASGHAGLALEVAYPVQERLGILRPLIFRHPGFDLRNASIFDATNTRVDGVHWLNFLGQPVLGELGGAEGLRARLQASSTEVRELEGRRVVVSLGSEPEAGDLVQGQNLPAYRELARVLEPWLEPFAWGALRGRGKAAEESEWRRWWRRFHD